MRETLEWATAYRAISETDRRRYVAALAALELLAADLAAAREAMRVIAGTATNLPHAERIDRDAMRSIARAWLASQDES